MQASFGVFYNFNRLNLRDAVRLAEELVSRLNGTLAHGKHKNGHATAFKTTAGAISRVQVSQEAGVESPSGCVFSAAKVLKLISLDWHVLALAPGPFHTVTCL
jgi:hypothetical protein